MGMGEPLNNYKNVRHAVEFMIDSKRMSLAPRHVTVSTVGVVSAMRRLTDDLGKVNLALSLHAPNQEVRLRIVPAAQAHRLEKVSPNPNSNPNPNPNPNPKPNPNRNPNPNHIPARS